MRKLYCYVDESGQDTGGKYFLVVVVLQEKKNIFTLEKKLEKVERETGKNRLKWNKSKARIRLRYLQKAFTLQNAESSHNLVVIIDCLNEREKDRVRIELKKLKIRHRTIRGMKDEQNAVLRLADSVAGFIRDINTKRHKISQAVLTRLPIIVKKLADSIS